MKHKRNAKTLMALAVILLAFFRSWTSLKPLVVGVTSQVNNKKTNPVDFTGSSVATNAVSTRTHATIPSNPSKERKNETISESQVGDFHDLEPFSVVVNLGPGTTATHAFFNATCRLGLKSVHFATMCNEEGKLQPLKGSKGAVLHRKIVAFWYQIRSCLREFEDCRIGDVEIFLDSMYEALKSLLALREIRAFHDTPYPYIFPLFQRAAAETNVRVETIISSRNPEDWAKRRLQAHANELACRGRNYDSTDWVSCFEDALGAWPPTRRKRSMTYRHVFVAFQYPNASEFAAAANSWKNGTPSNATLISLDKESTHSIVDVLEGFRKGFEDHMKKYEPSAVYVADLFEAALAVDASEATTVTNKTQVHVPIETLAQDMARKLSICRDHEGICNEVVAS